jgi:alkanesulfonate monooxygenase SsuD/methylene tetrahydromethanopterin reductase-like flavin-dependent oxidoreductase (luciferase family)
MPERASIKLAVHVRAAGSDVRRFVELAHLAERAGFHAIMLHDTAQLEPTALVAALATATTRIGLIAAATTSDNEPYNLARRFAALDHISGGRAGWQLVAGDDDSARVAEFYDVVAGLWDSWEDGALKRDKANGLYMDRDKIHFLDHVGTHFRVKGPLNITRSPQGWPVVVMDAGSSETERELAARGADVIVITPLDLADAQAQYADLTARAARHGRARAAVKIMAVVPPESAADALEHGLDHAAADGFLVSCDDPPAFENFTRQVIPELQRRGRCRRDDAGATLRAALGLPIPENRYTVARRGAAS